MPTARPSRLPARAAALTLVAALVATLAAPARAQSRGDGFLFGRPPATLSIRAGFDRASARSDVFDFVQEQLTVDRGDFGAFTAAADLGITLGSRVELMLGAAYARSSARSEFREFVDLDDLPIEQTTTFTRVPLTAGVKAYLAPRGRTLGRLAWVPSRVAPFVGAGGGVMWYEFRQRGDFVDFDDLGVFPADLRSSGATPIAHALAGVDVTLSPRLALTTEARYTWGRADLGDDDFSQFDRIDLSGIAATAGISIRF